MSVSTKRAWGSDTSRTMNILSVKILVLSNIFHFLEKWLITGLTTGMAKYKMSLEHLVQETRKCSKNDRDISKGQEPA